MLYGAGSRTVWALGVRDGREIWSVPRDPDADASAPVPPGEWLRPFTDGRQLLLAEDGVLATGLVDGESSARLRAWSLASGEALWSAPLPRAAEGYFAVDDGVLYDMWDELVRLD